jgi:hypothetical protein
VPSKLTALRALTFRDIGLLFEAVMMLAIARFFIKFVPFAQWKDRLDIDRKGVAARVPIATDKSLSRHIGRIVRMAARNVPFKAVCLPQAMAAQWMLRRRGEGSKIVIGADRKAKADASQGNNRFDLHAWLVSSEAIIITGKSEYARFHAFSAQNNAANATSDAQADLASDISA